MSTRDTKPKAAPAAAETVTVRLTRACTHAGRAYEAGEDLDVTPAQAAVLRAHGLID